jgi:hypothetical protein
MHARTPPEEPDNNNDAPRSPAARRAMTWIEIVVELTICLIIVPLIMLVIMSYTDAFSWTVGQWH